LLIGPTVKAEALLRERHHLAPDAFVEVRIWRVLTAVRGSAHDLKCALAYVVRGGCVLRYDNEAGKGDHRHLVQPGGLCVHHAGAASGRFLE
jgi:hypothetical protein